MIGQAQTGTGKTAAFGLPMIDFVDPERPRHAGARAHADARAVHPGHAGAAHLRQAPRHRSRRRVRRRADPHPAGAAQAGRAGRRRDGRARARPDLAPLAHRCTRAATSCSTRPTRCSTSASSRTSRRSSRSRPNGRQTALFSATMPAEIRALAERHLYDPVTVKVKAATLTIDTVEQFFVETKAADKNETLVRVLEAERPDAGDRLRAHEDPLRPALPHAARPRHERQGAARRHEPGRARRRDDLVQGRARADPRGDRRRRARARHLDGHAHHQLRRPDLAGRLRAPDRPHRPRRALGARDHVRRAAPGARARGDRAARQHEDLAVGARARTSRRRRSRSGARAATASRTTTRAPSTATAPTAS